MIKLFHVIVIGLTAISLIRFPISASQGIGGNAGFGGTAGLGGGATAGGSAPTVVQSAACTGTTTCTMTFSPAITAGHRIFIFSGSNGANNNPTMTGETFTHLTGATGCSNSSGYNGDCYIEASATGGQTSLSCSTAGSIINCIGVEVTAPSGLSPVNDAGGNANVSATSFTVSTSASTTNSSDLILGMFYTASTSSTAFTVGGSYTLVKSNLGEGSMMIEQYAPGSTGTQTATATNATSSNTAEGILAIKP